MTESLVDSHKNNELGHVVEKENTILIIYFIKPL